VKVVFALLLLTLTAHADEACLQGRLIDADGRGVGGASVSLVDHEGRQAAYTLSKDDGRYLLHELRPGSYTLDVVLSGFEPVAKVLRLEGAMTLDLPLRLAGREETVVVTSRGNSLLDAADSAGQGVTGATDLADRPMLRTGEMLEAVPGIIVTQHAGGGKANQYFLRGFNLDHGTDFAVFLDDTPLNLPSHGHGEGYSDMNVVIPEFVETVNFRKGPYVADVGDFGSAGAAHLIFVKTLAQDFLTLEPGMYGFGRVVAGASETVGAGHLLLGGEAYHEDGPWVRPDDYLKLNGLVTYSQGDAVKGFSLSARGYHGRWNSSDQIPESLGATNLFGTLNPTDGGNSSRLSLQGEWHREEGETATKIMVYGFRYDLDLFSDFTYFLTDPVLGDQFEQQDGRWVTGTDARRTWLGEWWGRRVENTVGVQVRNDWIRNGLYQTADRVRVAKIDSQTGTPLPAITELDVFTDTQAGVYAQSRIQLGEKVRTVASLRGDVDLFDVTSLVNPANTGTSTTFLPSPRLNVSLGPWGGSEIYLEGGFGFHSNDGRGATQTVEPVSGENPYPGTPSARIPGLIQTKGGEVGVRTVAVPHLQSTVSLWFLHSDSELQQSGDTGETVPSKQPSDRYGVEWANYLTLVRHLALDLDLADSIARFTSVDADDAAPRSPGGTHVPEAVGRVIAAGLTLRDLDGASASVRLRYFGPRDLTSDGIYRSRDTTLLNAEIGYEIGTRWRVAVEILNLLNRRDHDIDYVYLSRPTPTSSPTFQDVFHPVEPRQVRISLTARFSRASDR
jgi:hypothetical protein